MSIECKHVMEPPTTGRTRRLRVKVPLAALFFIVIGLLVASASPAYAMPPDPIAPDPVGGDEPVSAPANGFDWRVPSRFGTYANGIIDYHWIPDAFNPFVPGHYQQTYVNPTSFPVNIDACRNDTDEITGTSPMTYTWTLRGQTRINHLCAFQEVFSAQGTYPVSLTITRPDGTVVLDPDGSGNPFTQNIVVKDILVVSLGDSYASGEGNPDKPQVLGYYDFITGQPMGIESPAVWQDRRCHRSAYAAPARAALALEAADPHTSVTFLSFACSGGTINREYYADQSAFQPYQSPGAAQWSQYQGSGILGPQAGPEPPNPDRPQDNMRPSQIDQLVAALTNNGQIATPRPVDALLVSGGGNDMGFGNIVTICAMYYNCGDYRVDSVDFSGLVPMTTRVQQDIGELPARYTALASQISTRVPLGSNGKVYISEYPDSTRNDNGGFCAKMVDDVVPWWLQPVLAVASVFGGGPYPPLPPYQMDGAENQWAGNTIVPSLNNAVAAAAQAHSWVLVDGIADASNNLFSGHGYCASDNWIRTATEAVNMQGPWVPWNATLLPPASIQTRGTLHPTAQGNQMLGNVIFAKMAVNLLPAAPPAGAPSAPTFVSTSNNSLTGANGWLTGHTAGQTCPPGAADCAFAQVTSSVTLSTTIQGASLTINGAPAACTATGVTVNGVFCQASLANPQTYNWSFAFPSDGVFHLEFTVSARNGTVGKLAREVKVDLHNPVATAAFSTAVPASGWYTAPVTITLTGADAGSGIDHIEYAQGGVSAVAGGSTVRLPLSADGIYTITHRAFDAAGRANATQSLTVKLDQTAPAVQCAAADGVWHANDASVACTASDGGSGIASADASFTLTTTVASGAESANASTGSRAVCDAAGNCTQAGPVSGNQVDKKAPVIGIITPTNTAYLLNQVVAAGYSCSDGGSGMATCSGTLSSGTALDTSSLGAKTFTVSATDKVGNASSQTANYRVGYNICVLYDQSKAHKAGSTVPIKLQLCDATGANASTAAVVPVVTGLTQSDSTASGDVVESSSANPDAGFRYDATLNGYIYNLSTKGLATGTWVLSITVPGDPVGHAVQFDVR